MPVLMAIVFTFTVLLSQAHAVALMAGQEAQVGDEWPDELIDKKGYIARFGLFTDDSMDEAYGNYGAFMFNIGGEDLKNYKSGRGVWWSVRSEAGMLIGSGEPLKWYNNYDIVDQSLEMVVVPASATILRQITDFKKSDFMTYWGLGIDFFLGFERMECYVTKEYAAGTAHYDWHDTCYRHSFAGHALIGLSWEIKEKFSLLCELRWTQGGKGRLKRAVLSEDQIMGGYDDVFADFQHPDFNFTGASVDIGVKW